MTNVNMLTECMYEDEIQVRVLGTKLEPWFVAVDIFKILGLSLKNMSRTLENLDDDEKLVIDLSKNSTASPFKLKGEKTKIVQGSHNTVWIISEPGLYKIMLSSRSEKAKQFTRWVTHEVLPRIRKYGYYKLSTEERKLVAYKKIAKLRGAEELEDNAYSVMSADMLELKVKMFESQDEFEIERADTIKKFPYTYDEMDKLCDYDLEFIKGFVPQEERDKYYKILKNGEQWYSEKFKKEIPKFMKKGFGKPIKSLQNRK